MASRARQRGKCDGPHPTPVVLRMVRALRMARILCTTSAKLTQPTIQIIIAIITRTARTTQIIKRVRTTIKQSSHMMAF